MNNIQFQNWVEFSVRVARECQPSGTEPRKKTLEDAVRRYIEDAQEEYGEDICAWDSAPYPCDFFDDWAHDDRYAFWDDKASQARTTRFGSLLMCCIRAGFDVAIEPSAGVIGSDFTVGMLRRMYPEGLPGYVTGFFTDDIRPLPGTVQIWL